MNQNKKAINLLSNMMIITVLMQVFVLIKNALVAANFGVSIELDAFYFASNISNFIYSFLGAGISTIIIPALRNKENKKKIDVFVTIIYTTGFLLLILMLVFKKPMIQVLSGIDDIYFIQIAAKVIVFTLVAGFINFLLALARGLLEYREQFIKQKLILLFTSIFLVYFLWIENDYSIYYYSSLISIVAVLNLLLHLYLLRKNEYKYQVNFNIKTEGVSETLKLFLPVALGQGVYQISLLIDTMVAARLDVGSITILNYANAIISMINILFLGNLISYFYPKLIKKETEEERQQALLTYIFFVNTILCLIVVIFFAVGKDGISILYERGNFTKQNTNIVFICAFIYAISIPTDGIRNLIYKYFYTKQDTMTPFINGIMISVLNIIISLTLSSIIGLYGVIIGTVIASYVSLILITFKLQKKYIKNLFSKKKQVIEHIKLIIVSFLAVLIINFMKKILFIDNIYFAIIFYSLLTSLIFFLLLVMVRSKVWKIKL